MFIFFTQLSLKVELSESNTIWQENRVWHEIATQGHSRSYSLQYKSARDCLSRYNAGLLCKVLEEVATEIAKNVVVDNPTVVWRHLPEETPAANIRIYHTFYKVQSLPYIVPLIVWVCLHTNFSVWLRKTIFFSVGVRFGRSKVHCNPRSLILVRIESAYQPS